VHGTDLKIVDGDAGALLLRWHPRRRALRPGDDRRLLALTADMIQMHLMEAESGRVV